jgi:putative copper resistance protein D
VSAPLDTALWICRFVHFTTAMLVFGATSFRFYAIPADWLAGFDRRFGRVVLTAAAIALLSALALLLCLSAMIAGAPAAAWDPAVLAAVLSGTRFGRVWSLQLLLALALVLACLRRTWKPSLILSLGLLASLGWVGHAAIGEGVGGIMRELNQSLHLLAAGWWLGGLAPLGWVLGRVRQARDEAAAALTRGVVERFSRGGHVAVALIALTGLVNTLLLVGSPGTLFDAAYGRLLAFKILLFAGLVAVALCNRFLLAPRLGREPAALGHLCRTVAIEQGLGLAILAVVSVLGTLPPAVAPPQP